MFDQSNSLQLAQQDHRLHHLNAQTLRLQYSITREQAREIVKSCKACLSLLPEPHTGVNPRGLVPGELWQMDVTHYSAFGNLKYIHVTVDTFSGFVCASLQTGEATKDVIAHVLHCFTIIPVPIAIKTDNGPGYISSKFKDFCKKFGITHKTGIPFNPQGQGVVERANQTLKNMLFKLSSESETLYARKGKHRLLLNHVLFVLNFLWTTMADQLLIGSGTLPPIKTFDRFSGRMCTRANGSVLTQSLSGEKDMLAFITPAMEKHAGFQTSWSSFITLPGKEPLRNLLFSLSDAVDNKTPSEDNTTSPATSSISPFEF